ncbi:MAG: hypothetical protein LW860_08915 [Xanthomonadaceae bacterium]|nr:hypothetical protein [Xanthomonadaceae bacterium]
MQFVREVALQRARHPARADVAADGLPGLHRVGVDRHPGAHHVASRIARERSTDAIDAPADGAEPGQRRLLWWTVRKPRGSLG